ncbi:MAG: hypothetical protein IPH28_17715 [Cytophagaceae bacterium]|nr:hypothetical protein [Cytophagaceae bacterium]
MESEISKINKVASENKFTDLTVNKLNKEVSTNELHIANLKKSLNEIREISDRIKEVFNWDYWLRKKIEENLEPDEITNLGIVQILKIFIMSFFSIPHWIM